MLQIDNHETESPAGAERVGEWVGNRVGGYLRARREWESKSPLEKMIMKLSDARKGYKGCAPAGQPEKAWGFEIVENKTGHLCVPVGEPLRDWPYTIDFLGRVHRGKTPTARMDRSRYHVVSARSLDEADAIIHDIADQEREDDKEYGKEQRKAAKQSRRRKK
jgi:hypothetical protein